jgi:hypothetical protein
MFKVGPTVVAGMKSRWACGCHPAHVLVREPVQLALVTAAAAGIKDDVRTVAGELLGLSGQKFGRDQPILVLRRVNP